MTIAETRRTKLRSLLERYGGQAGLARECGKAPAYISQLITGHRNAGEATARSIERSLGLAPGWLDSPQIDHEDQSPLPIEFWLGLPPEAKALLRTIVQFYSINGSSFTDQEKRLLEAFRACPIEAQEVVLSVAEAQRVAHKSRSGKRGRKLRSNSAAESDAVRPALDAPMRSAPRRGR